MSETPNLDRFLQTKELWEEYMELSDELNTLESKFRSGRYSVAVYEGRASDAYPIGSTSISQLALQGAITSLQVRKTELAGVLRNTFHLEV